MRKIIIRFCNNIRHSNEINKRGGGIFFLLRVEFFKIGKREFTFIREMRVMAKNSRQIRFNIRCQFQNFQCEMIRTFISKITWIDELVSSMMSVSIVLPSFPSSSEKLVSFAHASFPRESFCTVSKECKNCETNTFYTNYVKYPLTNNYCLFNIVKRL